MIAVRAMLRGLGVLRCLPDGWFGGSSDSSRWMAETARLFSIPALARKAPSNHPKRKLHGAPQPFRLATLWISLFTALSIATAQPLTPVASPGGPASRLVGAAASDSAPSAVRVAGDSAAAASGPKSRADTAQIVKHHFNHRQQIITGGVIMACMAMIMTVMNNYNPQVQQP
jgi:hypothetical protein